MGWLPQSQLDHTTSSMAAKGQGEGESELAEDARIWKSNHQLQTTEKSSRSVEMRSSFMCYKPTIFFLEEIHARKIKASIVYVFSD